MFSWFLHKIKNLTGSFATDETCDYPGSEVLCQNLEDIRGSSPTLEPGQGCAQLQDDSMVKRSTTKQEAFNLRMRKHLLEKVPFAQDEILDVDSVLTKSSDSDPAPVNYLVISEEESDSQSDSARNEISERRCSLLNQSHEPENSRKRPLRIPFRSMAEQHKLNELNRKGRVEIYKRQKLEKELQNRIKLSQMHVYSTVPRQYRGISLQTYRQRIADFARQSPLVDAPPQLQKEPSSKGKEEPSVIRIESFKVQRNFKEVADVTHLEQESQGRGVCVSVEAPPSDLVVIKSRGRRAETFQQAVPQNAAVFCEARSQTVTSESERSWFTPKQIHVIRNAWDLEADPEYLLAKIGDIPLTRRDLMSLRDGEWLNDEVINACMELLNRRSQQDGRARVYFWNTHFYVRLMAHEQNRTQKRYTYANVKRWTKRKKLDVFELDRIVIPVHEGIHWTCAVVNFSSRTLEYYDSSDVDNDGCLEGVLQWLKDEALDKRGSAFYHKFCAEVQDEWNLNYAPRMPKQDNSSDCGVFLLAITEAVGFNFPIEFNCHDMPRLRRQYLLNLIETTAREMYSTSKK